MGDNWYQKSKNLLINCSSIPREIFYFFTLTLLTLLLPLSFLLLAKLSSAQFYLQNFINLYYQSNSPPYILSLAIKINPFTLYPLVSTVSIASLIHGLTGNKITIFRDSSSSNNNVNSVLQPRLYFAWILLCSFQICVGLGIEGSIEAGFYSYDTENDESMSFGVERSLLSRVIFLLGLHETTQFWSKIVVRPVVDDTVFGGVKREEKWIENVGMAASLGTLWWWKLRDDVETLVVVAEVKKEQMMDVGIGDFVGWWLYYVTVTIGMVRVVKGLMWMFMICLCTRRRTTEISTVESDEVNDDKV